MNLVLLTALISAAGQLFLKSGMQRNSHFLSGGFNFPEIVKIFLNPLVFLGFLFYAVSSVLYLKLLSGANLSFTYPTVVASTFVAITISSIILLSDTLSPYKLVGLIGIIAGIALVVRS